MVHEYRGKSHDEVLGQYIAAQIPGKPTLTYQISLNGVVGERSTQYEDAFVSALGAAKVDTYIPGVQTLEVLLVVDEAKKKSKAPQPSGAAPKVGRGLDLSDRF